MGRDNILIRPYESGRWVGGDIVQDFCALTGIELAGSGELSVNESLGPNQLYIKRCLNRVGYDKGENENVLALLLAACPEAHGEHCMYVHRGLYRDYRLHWIQVNKHLSRTTWKERHCLPSPSRHRKRSPSTRPTPGPAAVPAAAV